MKYFIVLVNMLLLNVKRESYLCQSVMNCNVNKFTLASQFKIILSLCTSLFDSMLLK